MAVEFISKGYDPTSNPYTAEGWADTHPSIGLAKYGVRSPGDWKVTAVASQDRTVAIAAGRGFGHGVTDKTFAIETIQLNPITSGSRWDLIACRRDWTTTGVSSFAKVNGGAAAVIPGGRNSNAGGIDDQPLALVQVTANQAQPTAIIDLRTWSGDGGGIVANHDLVRSFLNTAGTRIQINGINWVRRVGANDTNEWYQEPYFKDGQGVISTGTFGDFTFDLPSAFANQLLSVQIQEVSPISNNDYGVVIKPRIDLCDRTKIVGRCYKTSGGYAVGNFNVSFLVGGI